MLNFFQIPVVRDIGEDYTNQSRSEFDWYNPLLSYYLYPTLLTTRNLKSDKSKEIETSQTRINFRDNHTGFFSKTIFGKVGSVSRKNHFSLIFSTYEIFNIKKVTNDALIKWPSKRMRSETSADDIQPVVLEESDWISK